MTGKRCRLVDIHATFEGTGLGFTSYAIIEQGRIQNITASKPLEMRSLIEEAARIVSFKQRKKAALVKLELAEQNLANALRVPVWAASLALLVALQGKAYRQLSRGARRQGRQGRLRKR